jgi:hypothetical protein
MPTNIAVGIKKNVTKVSIAEIPGTEVTGPSTVVMVEV